MKVWVLIVVALLAVPAVTALFDPYFGGDCRTRTDCKELQKTIRVVCATGMAFNPEPECVNHRCAWCKPVITRPTVDCRVDSDCAAKKCSTMQASKCSGSKCVCAAIKSECVTDRDCMRGMILGSKTYQRKVCQRMKCIVPQALNTMLPRYATPGGRY